MLVLVEKSYNNPDCSPILPFCPFAPAAPWGPIVPVVPCVEVPVVPWGPTLPWEPCVPAPVVPCTPWRPWVPCDPKSPVLFKLTFTPTLLPKAANVPPALLTSIAYHWFPDWIAISFIAKSKNIVGLAAFEILIHPWVSDKLVSMLLKTVNKSLLFWSNLLK